MPADASRPESQESVTEVELKLQASDRLVLRRLARRRRLGDARLGPARTVDELDRYLDTADGRLAAVAWACRLRSREGSTIVSLKGPRSSRDGEGSLHSRPELEGAATLDPDPRAWPPSPARDLVLRLADGRPLVELLELRQRRTERSVEVGGERMGLLSLDRVEVVQAGKPVGRLFIVELEVAPAPPEGAVPLLAAALDGIRGLRPDPLSKLEHALPMLKNAEQARR
jgi:inorganic triphosphatase YgiF